MALEQLTGEKDVLEFPGKKVTGNMGKIFRLCNFKGYSVILLYS